MKLLSFMRKGQVVPGVLVDESIIDVSPIYESVQTIIDDGVNGIKNVNAFLKGAQEKLPFVKSELVAPIPDVRRNIFCIGWNYMKHFEERVQQHIEYPTHPNVFTKATTTVAAPFEEIAYDRAFTQSFDYEAELAVIIGKKGKQISEEDALDYVFGYACANDLSARDVQQKHGGQWFLGKSIDRSCPIGPWITMKEDIEDIQTLNIECRLNGQVVQSSNTSHMIFPIKRLIAELSKAMTLLPGDIILTGTPDGIGSKRNPPLLLKEGDTVEVHIEKLGSISNTIHETSLEEKEEVSL